MPVRGFLCGGKMTEFVLQAYIIKTLKKPLLLATKLTWLFKTLICGCQSRVMTCLGAIINNKCALDKADWLQGHRGQLICGPQVLRHHQFTTKVFKFPQGAHETFNIESTDSCLKVTNDSSATMPRIPAQTQ